MTKKADGHAEYNVGNAVPTADALAIVYARAARAEEGLRQVEEIATAIVGNPGLERNTVELVNDMAHLIQHLRGDTPRTDAAIASLPQFETSRIFDFARALERENARLHRLLFP